MARFRRFRRFYGGARSRFSRFRGSRFGRGVGISMPYVGGAALGYLAPRVHPLQDLAITTLAVLPIRLPRYVGPICKGYVLGSMARAFLPSIGGIGAAPGGIDFA